MANNRADELEPNASEALLVPQTAVPGDNYQYSPRFIPIRWLRSRWIGMNTYGPSSAILTFIFAVSYSDADVPSYQIMVPT